MAFRFLRSEFPLSCNRTIGREGQRKYGFSTSYIYGTALFADNYNTIQPGFNSEVTLPRQGFSIPALAVSY